MAWVKTTLLTCSVFVWTSDPYNPNCFIKPGCAIRRSPVFCATVFFIHALLRIPDYEYLLGHPVIGKSWEGFVIEKILARLPLHVYPFFYRTSAGAEIDLLLESGLGDYWAIEIKYGKTPKVKKGFHVACDDLGVKRKFVVYSGEDTFSLGNETTVISLPLFLNEMGECLG